MVGKNPKPKKKVERLHYRNLEPSEVVCPVCRTIFVEPVTLPCDHVFCKECFEDTMENVTLGCPLCRNRVGSWVRTAKKADKFINKEFWEAIQSQYAKALRNKYHGFDNDFEKEEPVIIVARPGDIRKEYEKEKNKHLEEQNKSKAEEEMASAALIKNLSEEEAHEKQAKEEQLRKDELLAQKLQEELNAPSTSRRLRPVNANKAGPLDRFIKNQSIKNSKNSPEQKQPKKLFVAERKVMCSSSGDNSDIIDQECRFYFKPIDLNKKYHKPGKVPLKVSAVKGLLTGKKIVRTDTEIEKRWRRKLKRMIKRRPRSPLYCCGFTTEEIEKTGKALDEFISKWNSFTGTNFRNESKHIKDSIEKSRSQYKTYWIDINRNNSKTSLNNNSDSIQYNKQSKNYFAIIFDTPPLTRIAYLIDKFSKIQLEDRNPEKAKENTLWSAAGTSRSENTSWFEAGTSSSENALSSEVGTSRSENTSWSEVDTSRSQNTSWSGASTSSSENTSWSEAGTSSSENTSWSEAGTSRSENTLWSEAGTSRSSNVESDLEDLNQEMFPSSGKWLSNASPEERKRISNATPEERKRKRQEKYDFAFAKMLQAEFDRIHILPTTRRGTKRKPMVTY